MHAVGGLMDGKNGVVLATQLEDLEGSGDRIHEPHVRHAVAPMDSGFCDRSNRSVDGDRISHTPSGRSVKNGSRGVSRSARNHERP